MRTPARLSACATVAIAVAWLSGCRDQATSQGTGTVSQNAAAASAELNPEASEAQQKLTTSLSQIINDATARYRPLDYDYNEDLLKILDRVETHLSGKDSGTYKRVMPKLDEQEEDAHLRETIRRWEAKSGKNLRTELDKLNAEVAARKPGESFHPDFQKHFSAAFDDFIPIEVAEIHERRNAAIHEQARPLLDEYRTSHPDLVRQQEDVLNKPPYNLPTARPDEK